MYCYKAAGFISAIRDVLLQSAGFISAIRDVLLQVRDLLVRFEMYCYKVRD